MRSPAEGAQYFDLRESADSSSPSPPSEFSNRFRFQDSRLDIDLPPHHSFIYEKKFEYIFYQQLRINKISIDRCISIYYILEFYLLPSDHSSIHILRVEIISSVFVSLFRFKIFNIPSRCKNYSLIYTFYNAITYIYMDLFESLHTCI